MSTMPPYDALSAAEALAASDPAMADLIARVGPPDLTIEPPESLLDGLLRAIVFQQLSGKAASTIYRRVLERLGGSVTLEGLQDVEDQGLRDAGMSRAKIASARDLAERVRTRELPTLSDLATMSDAEITERLIAVRGIGTWTVQMLLISRLGRPDVWPSTDLGIRKGVALLTGGDLSDPPPAAVVEKAGEPFRPWRSLAAWYLWRSLDLSD